MADSDQHVQLLSSLKGSTGTLSLSGHFVWSHFIGGDAGPRQGKRLSESVVFCSLGESKRNSEPSEEHIEKGRTVPERAHS